MQTLILTYPTPVEDDAVTEGKFLQLRLATQDYLLFAVATDYRYHNQILAHFLSEQAIPHRWESAENLVVDHPRILSWTAFRVRLAWSLARHDEAQ